MILKKLIAPDNDIGHKFLDSHAQMKNLYRAYKMFMFYKQSSEFVKKRLRIPIRSYESSNKYDIINFQYYNTQGSLYHKTRDFLANLKQHPHMYDRMVEEVENILIRYHQAIKKIKMMPAQHDKIAFEFLRDLMSYLSSHTFRIHERNWNKRTGVVYREVF
jgi:hypothetical protein